MDLKFGRSRVQIVCWGSEIAEEFVARGVAATIGNLFTVISQVWVVLRSNRTSWGTTPFKRWPLTNINIDGLVQKRRSTWRYISLHQAKGNYSDVIMSAMASQITSLTIVYSTVYKGIDQRKHQSSASLAFVRGIHWWLVNTSHKGPVTRKMFPFDDVIMIYLRSPLDSIREAVFTVSPNKQ